MRDVKQVEKICEAASITLFLGRFVAGREVPLPWLQYSDLLLLEVPSRQVGFQRHAP